MKAEGRPNLHSKNSPIERTFSVLIKTKSATGSSGVHPDYYLIKTCRKMSVKIGVYVFNIATLRRNLQRLNHV